MTSIRFVDGAILFDTGAVAMSEDCCCDGDCFCTAAPQPYNSAPAFSCVSADYGSYSTKTTATFTISGTPALIPFASGCSAGTVPDPSGSWAFALSGGPFVVAYRNYMVVCEDATNYYVIQACIAFSSPGFQCDTTGTIGTWSYVTRGIVYPKSGPAPLLTSGWEEFGTVCSTGGGEGSTGNITFKMPTDCCATVWTYQLGPFTYLGTTYNCLEACNVTQCFPKCFTNALVKATTHSNTSNPGVDYSGMTVSLAFT